ncbi:ATP-dependent DNA ligase [Micromonospora sp. NPDC051141]|uniref:ATP-dependent DNA ligase n=1 Tax=Micromonospora sp. NPDC051141 TaxID=3364284 RepID=UPI00379FE7F1
MRAAGVAELPDPRTYRGRLAYEPKWDGWRVISWVSGQRVVLQSRQLRDLTRYFPDLVGHLQAHVGAGAVIDGEMVSWDAVSGRSSFPALQRRVTAGRGLAAEVTARPAYLVAFDLLADVGGEELLRLPLAERRVRLLRLLTGAPPQLLVCPQTLDVDEARGWMRDWVVAGVEGIVVKDLTSRYTPGQAGWLKLKSRTTTEAIIAGVTGTVATPGSLLLGRLDARGRLRYVARTHPLGAAQRGEVAGMLQPALGAHPWPAPLPGAWTGQLANRRPLPYVPVHPSVVAEVEVDLAYEHGRWRHHSRFVRIRAELEPAELPLWSPNGLAA